MRRHRGWKGRVQLAYSAEVQCLKTVLLVSVFQEASLKHTLLVVAIQEAGACGCAISNLVTGLLPNTQQLLILALA